MGYKVKWVEDHLGITRKALRTYEEKGVMPRNKYGQYRNYSEEDIYRIWTIKVLQGIGYSLKEIANIEKVDDFNPDASIAEKIKDLEKEQARIEQVLGYARTIKLTGRLPSWPKEMGSMKFEDFYKKSLNEWNINDDPASQAYQSLADSVLNKSAYDWQEADFEKMMDFLMSLKEYADNWEGTLADLVLPKAIISRKNLGTSDQEVQLLVKIIYESRLKNISDLMTKDQFVRFEASSYLVGDIVKIRQRDYGEEGCKFVADAIAVFGGYSCYDDVDD